MTDFLLTLGSLSLVMTVLILLLTGLDLAFGGRIMARARYLLWIMVILRLCMVWETDILPPLVEIPELTASESEIPPADKYTDSGPVTAVDADIYQFDELAQVIERPDPTPAVDIRVIDPAKILFAIWLTGAFLYFAGTMAGYGMYTVLLRRKLMPADEKTVDALRILAERKQLRRIPELYISESADSPMLCGYFRPMIVLPAMGLDENAAAAILSHELNHLKRGDLWVKLLCTVAVSLHWFNPAVWMARYHCARTMELACDEAVLADHGYEVRSAYGNVLFEILRRCSQPANRRKAAPLTTQFQPGKQLMKERFTRIMDESRKNSGAVLLVLVFILCAISGGIVGCVKDEVPASTVPWVNLDHVSLEFDGYGQLTSASFTDWNGEELFSDYTNGGVPVFLNGSLIVGGDIAVEYFGVDDDYAVDFYALFNALYEDKSRSSEQNPEHSYFKLDEPDVIESVEFIYETGEVFVNGIKRARITFHTEAPEPYSIPHHVYLSPKDCAEILQLNMTVIKPNGGVHANFAHPTGETDSAFQYSIPGPYLNNEQQIIFWRYPDDAVQLTEAEALLKLQDALIEAYENTYGRFEPLTDKPESSPYPGDEIMLRWQIPNLTVTGANDRFWRVEFMGEMLIDKYTGDIYRYYNGLARFFAKFDPEDPGALMFAG